MAGRNIRNVDNGPRFTDDTDPHIVDDAGSSAGSVSGAHEAALGALTPQVGRDTLGAQSSGQVPPPIDAAERARQLMSTEVRDWGSPDDPLWATHKDLARFLFTKSWNKIAPRECGMITLTVRPTGITVSLKLPSEAQSVSVLVATSDLIWDALQHALIYRSGDWKELKNGPGAQKLREDRKKLLEIEKSKK